MQTFRMVTWPRNFLEAFAGWWVYQVLSPHLFEITQNNLIHHFETVPLVPPE